VKLPTFPSKDSSLDSTLPSSERIEAVCIVIDIAYQETFSTRHSTAGESSLTLTACHVKRAQRALKPCGAGNPQKTSIQDKLVPRHSPLFLENLVQVNSHIAVLAGGPRTKRRYGPTTRSKQTILLKWECLIIPRSSQ
jgi:hypothetical protein